MNEYEHKIVVDHNSYKKGIKYLENLGYRISEDLIRTIDEIDENFYLLGNINEERIMYCNTCKCDSCDVIGCKYVEIDYIFSREEKLRRLLNENR